jgi:hypothetical protein
MFKLYISAAVVLFWVSLSVVVFNVQLAASPVHKMRVSTYHSMPIRSTTIAQVSATSTSTSASYN